MHTRENPAGGVRAVQWKVPNGHVFKSAPGTSPVKPFNPRGPLGAVPVHSAIFLAVPLAPGEGIVTTAEAKDAVTTVMALDTAASATDAVKA